MGHRASDYKKPHKVPEKNKIIYKERVFALTKEEAHEAPTVVIGTLLINGSYSKILFNSGVTHSFISHIFANSLGYHCWEPVDDEFWVKTPMGADVRITHKILSLEVSLINRCLSAEVYVLGMKDFDVILGMDWLEAHYALLDYRHKKIVFRKLGEEEFTF